MALKDKWVDKIDGVDINAADDINQVAQAVIELEGKAISRDDVATTDVAGVVKVVKNNNGKGITISDGTLHIAPATKGNIDNGVGAYTPIVVNTIDYAVRRALTNPKNIDWTKDQKESARELLGTDAIFGRRIYGGSPATMTIEPTDYGMYIMNDANIVFNGSTYSKAYSFILVFKSETDGKNWIRYFGMGSLLSFTLTSKTEELTTNVKITNPQSDASLIMTVIPMNYPNYNF